MVALAARRAALEPSALEVDLGAIRDNVGAIRDLVGPGCDIYGALKCNAYGFGLVPVARTLADAGAAAVAVARLQDAVELRDAGVTLPVLLYGGAVVTPEVVQAIERYGLTPTILDLEAAETLSRHLTTEVPVFVKVDVGQRRLGAEPRRLVSFVAAVASLPNVVLDGIYTHMTVPDDPVPAGHVDRQFAVFAACLDEVAAAGFDVRVRMAASSAVLRLTDAMNLTAVDPGRMLFGTSTDSPLTRELSFRSALRSLRTRLIQVKRLDEDPRRPPPPAAIADGALLGVIPLGLGDGLDRIAATEVLVRGCRARLVEPISLEHCRVDLSAVPDAAVGDEVVVIGRQGGDEITVDEVVANQGPAARNYVVPITIRETVPRSYAD